MIIFYKIVELFLFVNYNLMDESIKLYGINLGDVFDVV